MAEREFNSLHLSRYFISHPISFIKFNNKPIEIFLHKSTIFHKLSIGGRPNISPLRLITSRITPFEKHSLGFIALLLLFYESLWYISYYILIETLLDSLRATYIMGACGLKASKRSRAKRFIFWLTWYWISNRFINAYFILEEGLMVAALHHSNRKSVLIDKKYFIFNSVSQLMQSFNHDIWLCSWNRYCDPFYSSKNSQRKESRESKSSVLDDW